MLGLEHGGVLLGLIEFFLQRLCPEHCITIPLEHIGLLSGSLHDILRRAIIITRVLQSGGIRLLKGPVTYIHPLLSPTHRLQVAGYRRRVDKVIREKFEPIATSRCGLGHRRRTDRLRVLDFWRADNYFQARLRQCIVTHLLCHPRGCCLCRLGRGLCDHLVFRHDAFSRQGFGDYASLDLCPCQHKTYCISTRGL
jgi:hypothetical protein